MLIYDYGSTLQADFCLMKSHELIENQLMSMPYFIKEMHSSGESLNAKREPETRTRNANENVLWSGSRESNTDLQGSPEVEFLSVEEHHVPRNVAFQEMKLSVICLRNFLEKAAYTWVLLSPLMDSAVKLKTYILSTFSREMYKWGSENWYKNHLSIWVSYEKPSSSYCVM